MGADCVLDAGNQFSAPGSYQECPNELYFEVGHSINKFKFSGTVLVVSGCWNLVSSIKNACSTHTLYSMHILVRVNGGGLFENIVSLGPETGMEYGFWTKKWDPDLNLELDNNSLPDHH